GCTMNLRSLKSALLLHADKQVHFVLPDGDPIPAEFHVTEVGHVVKKFIDCGGTVRSQESCLLQAWVADNDENHRLTAGKFARILDLSRQVVPSEDLDVEVEYQSCAVGQYVIESMTTADTALTFTLGNKKTDCLARESCGVGSETTGTCCGGPEEKCC
ncbi:MAG TPA: DUF6428 family protein, partial [Candidatus Didemnitutus sp.]|nr:DUF6428 family protein [Candidatus Didemnitutus sp.]